MKKCLIKIWRYIAEILLGANKSRYPKCILLALLSCSVDAQELRPLLPNNKLTPGIVTNVPLNILIQPGYTHKVRNVSASTKKAVFVRYFGYVPKAPGDYEIDHLISLELGGSNSISNLWPQSYLTFPYNSKVKDHLEDWMAASIRHVTTTNSMVASNLLFQYQQEIATNWIVAYEKYLGTNK
jgi:hypothetical protein